jgi:CRISPR/Cas system-associated exonuclease Cas4 (RecB family)
MNDLVNLLMMIVFLAGVFLFLALQPRTGLVTTGMKMRRAIPAPWSLAEFLKMKPSQWKLNHYYSFFEECVISLGHRYVGRIDAAVLHWEEVPILDIVIEYKFPMNYLPKEARPEDVFQLGLYALALLESGVSCSSTNLVTIYCLQDKAKRCLEMKSRRDCWQCRDGKRYTIRFKPQIVLKDLKRLDEVWYKGRQPRPARKPSSCRACPFSDRECNYSVM